MSIDKPVMSIDEPIICGVDGSPGSRRAVATACELAQQLCSRLVLVHVVPPRPSMVPAAVPIGAHPVATAQMAELDQAEAQAAFASVGEDAAGPDIERVTEHGYAPDRLSALALTRGARLIVVGTRGRGPTRAALLGSVSQRLAASASRPVMVVPEPNAPVGDARLAPGPVVCGIDGSERAQDALYVATRLADDLHAALTIVSAWAADAQDTAGLAAIKTPAADHVERLIASGDPAEVLTQAASERKASLLIVGSRGRGALRARVLGSVSSTVTRRAHRPVVIVPPGACGPG